MEGKDLSARKSPGSGQEQGKLQPGPLPAGPAYYFYPLGEADKEIDLTIYWRILVRQWRICVAFFMAVMLAAVVYLLVATPTYRAYTLLMPAGDDVAGDAGNLISRFGGLSSLMGISLSGQGGNLEEAVATLRSRVFITEFIQSNELKPILFDDLWDAEKKAWQVDEEEDIPTDWKAYDFFLEDILQVSEDNKTGLYTVSVEWKDADLAANWANKLVRQLNRKLQEKAILEASRSIAFLEKELGKTSIVEMQTSIYNLIEAQTKNIMIANVREDFALKVIDPAVPPEKPARPKVILVLAAGNVAAIILAIFYVLFSEYLRGRKKESE